VQRLDIIEKTWLSDVQNKIWFQNKFLEEKEVIIFGNIKRERMKNKD
jgi:hypothetical protein